MCLESSGEGKWWCWLARMVGVYLALRRDRDSCDREFVEKQRLTRMVFERWRTGIEQDRVDDV